MIRVGVMQMADIDVNAMLKDYIKNLCKDNGVKDSNAIEVIGMLDSELNGFEGDLKPWNSDTFRQAKNNTGAAAHCLEVAIYTKHKELKEMENELRDKIERMEPLKQLEDISIQNSSI